MEFFRQKERIQVIKYIYLFKKKKIKTETETETETEAGAHLTICGVKLQCNVQARMHAYQDSKDYLFYFSELELF